MKYWLTISAGLILCTAITLSSCTPKTESEQAPFEASSLPLSVIGSHQNEVLQEAFSSLAPYRPTQPADTLVVLPDANGAHAELAELAHAAVQSGRRVIIFGDAPFSTLYPWRAGLWKQSIDPSQWTPGPALESIADIPLWNAFVTENQIMSNVRHIRINRFTRPLYQVEFKQVEHSAWIYHSLDTLPGESIPSIEFLSRSTMQGQPFVLRAEDAEEHPFYCVIPAEENWQLFRITPDAFTGSEGRHRLEDFNQVQTWSIGYDQRLLHFPVGRQTLEISPLYQGTVQAFQTSGFPDFPLAGGGHTFTGQVVHLEKEHAPKWHYTHPPLDISAPYPRSTAENGPHFEELIYGRTPDGDRIPAVTQIRYPEQTRGSWIWAGMNLADLDKRLLAELVELIYQSSRRPALLKDAYPNQFAFDPLAPMEITVQAVGFDYAPFKYLIEAQLETTVGRPLSRSSTKPFELNPSTGLFETRLILDGIAPMATAQTDYQIKVMLQNEGATQRTHDEIILPVKVLPKGPEADSRLFLRPNVNIFRAGRNSIQFFGLTYTPGYTMDAGEDWLSPDRFPVEIIRADLDRLSKAGINSLRIPCPSFEHPQQLRFLLQEIYRHGFLISLALPPIPPNLHPDLLADFFHTSGVLHAPQVFALELDGGFLKDSQSDATIKESWRAWLTEQFGSLQDAMEILGKGAATAPSLHQIRHPKEYIHPELLRAFQNDWASRNMGHQVRQLQAAGVQQMITAPVALNLLGPQENEVLSGFDVRAIAPHVDFLTLSAQFGYGTRDRVLQGATLSLLARGLAGGKPVVWQHIGMGLPLPPASRMTGHQKDLHTWGLELTRLSQAAGAFGDQYTDYTEVDTNRGLWHSPIHSQPALAAYIDHGTLLRNHRSMPRPWKGDRFSLNTRGGSLLDTWRAQLTADSGDDASLGPELRHTEFKKLTAKLDIERMVKADAGPLRSVNAEWSWIETQAKKETRKPGAPLVFKAREPVKLHLLNTGMPTWSASVKDQINTVWVEVRHEELQPKYLAVPETDFGETAVIDWYPHGYGTFQLRPVLWATGGFGESLDIDIQLKD